MGKSQQHFQVARNYRKTKTNLPKMVVHHKVRYKGLLQHSKHQLLDHSSVLAPQEPCSKDSLQSHQISHLSKLKRNLASVNEGTMKSSNHLRTMFIKRNYQVWRTLTAQNQLPSRLLFPSCSQTKSSQVWDPYAWPHACDTSALQRTINSYLEACLETLILLY